MVAGVSSLWPCSVCLVPCGTAGFVSSYSGGETVGSALCLAGALQPRAEELGLGPGGWAGLQELPEFPVLGSLVCQVAEPCHLVTGLNEMVPATAPRTLRPASVQHTVQVAL